MNLETKDPKDMEEIIMNKPVLVIMAAGMGSRYGGLKQLDPVDNDGQDSKKLCLLSNTRSKTNSKSM